MAQRQLSVWPDQIIRTPNGDIEVVSDEAYFAGLLKVGAMVPVGGGQIIGVVDRVPTGMPNESVTVRAIFQWSNHSAAKPQPEPHVEVRQHLPRDEDATEIERIAVGLDGLGPDAADLDADDLASLPLPSAVH